MCHKILAKLFKLETGSVIIENMQKKITNTELENEKVLADNSNSGLNFK